MKTLTILVLMTALAARTSPDELIAITWKHLSRVTYTQQFNKEEEMDFLYPSFGPSVKALDGKQIRIRGYMIPVDEYARLFVISAKPIAQCFFCGGAGPESLMELQFRKKGQRFKTDEIRTVSGRLRLNATDVDHLIYILQDAEITE